MAAEVIDLLDDSENEQPPLSNKKTQEDVVDLCESSDDEEPLKQRRSLDAAYSTSKLSLAVSKESPPLDDAAYYVNKAKEASRKRNNHSSDSDEDDDLFDTKGLSRKPFASTRKLPTTTVSRRITDSGTRTAAAGNASHPLTIDSDVDCPRNVEPPKVSFTKKAPPMASRKRPYPNSDSDDDDEALFHGGLTRKTASTPSRNARINNDLNRADSVNSASSSSRMRNPYQKASVPQPPLAIHADISLAANFEYPVLSNTTFPDERARFLLAFWRYGRSRCTRSFERPKLDQVAKRVVKLALSEHPIRSLEEYISKGTKQTVNLQQRDNVRQELEEGGLENIRTSVLRAGSHRQYFSISEACLVTLLEAAESNCGADLLERLAEKENWVPLKTLIPSIDSKLHSVCPGKLTRQKDSDLGVEYYLEPSTRSMEYMQVVKLGTKLDDRNGPLIKQHKLNGQLHFELLEDGYAKALRIRSRTFPAPPGHYRTSREVDKLKYRNVCIGVDRHEGGNKSLHAMCDRLDLKKCPYFVASLKIGDYVFFTNRPGTSSMDLLCPIIVERKSIEDVALSIHDGRWRSQKQRMYVAQFVFGYDNCRMVYIIEGNKNRQLVSGSFIGARRFNVDKEKLQAAIDNLKSEGFDVLRTTHVENSMFELARWAQRISKEIQDGTLKAEYTYEQFKQKMKEIPKDTDFSRIAKYYAQQRLEVEESKQPSTTAGVSSPNNNSNNNNQKKKLPLATRTAQTKQASMQSPFTVETEDPSRDDKYFGWSTADLQAECVRVGLPKSGGRAELLKRLNGPHPPKVWLERKKAQQYVPPRHNVASTALLVALYLYETEEGLTKDELYVKAEELCITKNPFSGGTTQTGPYHYDGWSSMKQLLSGDPALVILKNRRYKLTRSCDIAGYPLAKALHEWCHQFNGCNCANV